MPPHYKADLHIHSSFSDKPSFWALRKINCPESWTSPQFIYDTTRKMGMNFVTITDHNTIDGALEIAHRPGAFISAEITTCFPESGCQIEIIPLGLSEVTFREIMRLRKNVYELVAYLQREGIVHFVAHPLYDLNGKLSLEIIEKMLLMFEVFETRNGSRAAPSNALIANIIASLNPERYEVLRNKHKLSPAGITSWQKAVVGGSDDHSGFSPARAYTVSREGKTWKDFLSSIREKKVWAEGDHGDSLTLAHNIYGVGYRFYLEKLRPNSPSSLPFVNYLLKGLLNENSARSSWRDKLRFFIRKNRPEKYDTYDGRGFEEILDLEAKRIINNQELLRSINAEDKNRRVFFLISYLSNRMICIYAERLMKTPNKGDLFRILSSLKAMGMVHLLISPYYVSSYFQHRDKSLMNRLRKRFQLPDASAGQEKTALFTDTIKEINGVAITIKRMLETSKYRGVDLTVLACNNQEAGPKNGIMNFQPVGEFAIPEYPEMHLSFPPVLEVLDYVEQGGFTKIHASTPGPLGLLALFLSRLMDLPISATYHTNIPQYVRSLAEDVFLEGAAWSYIIWFYNQMDTVMVPSESTRNQLLEKGLAPEKIRPLSRWVDTGVFSPSRKNLKVWKKYGLDGEIKFLYVGRLSREKNLELLAEAFIETIRRGFGADLVLVGDGPYRAELEKKLEGYPVLFTGFLEGADLSTVYASADVFVFPSRTDTFGNVVLEAQASGLPVIVSDQGGPQELMVKNETGFVISAQEKSSLVKTLALFLKDREKSRVMGEKARRFVETKAIPPQDMYSTILPNSPAKTPY